MIRRCIRWLRDVWAERDEEYVSEQWLNEQRQHHGKRFTREP